MTKIKLLILVSILFGVTGFFYREKAFAIHFVDEDDNLVLAKYLLNGEKLYKDVFSHHQPLSYIFSAGVEKITQPNSLHSLITRHREAIIIWSFVWALLLISRFGLLMFFTVVTYELTKIYLLGNLFLSEAIVVYPLLYILAVAFIQRINRIKLDYFLVGICLALSLFLLSPIWPMLLILGLIISKKFDYKNIGLIILGFLIIVTVIIPFISIKDYVHNAFFINFNYYIPIVSKNSWTENPIKSIFTPILSLVMPIQGSKILIVIQTFSLVFLINLIIILRKHLFKTFIIIVVLGLANIRYIEPGQQYYSGFHMLPWFISLLFFCFYLTFINLRENKDIRIRNILISFITISTMFCFIRGGEYIFTKTDKASDYYINYSQQFDMGIAVNIMKNLNDDLFVVPDQWLIYWQADISHSTKMLNYYAWMSSVSELKDIVENNFQTSPPTFFYCDCVGSYFGLERYWNLYKPLKKDGRLTKLLVLKSKFNELSIQQRNQLKYYNFAID